MTTRRHFIMTATALLAGGALNPVRGFAQPQDFEAQMRLIEDKVKGRLGVTALDTGSQRRFDYRADERFAMCSTFKLLAAAAILKRVDEGQEQLARRVRYTASDLVTYSPVTEKHIADGMTLAELCEAAITLSDNTAGNLMLAAIGGPAGLTAYARTLGDPLTRLDRIETELNEAAPGDERDTTTPAAMAADIRKLLFSNALAPSSVEQLKAWLLANKTGDTRLRARLPAGWRVGDKTGSGERGTTNDVGFLLRPAASPIIVAAYLTETSAPMSARNEALAAVGEAVVAAFA